MNLQTWILPPLDFKPHIAPQKFEEMVETARDLIRNGDMFQCVLSQRFSAEVTGNPFDFYRNLRVTNPSNYLYFYDFGDYQIIGASPESFGFCQKWHRDNQSDCRDATKRSNG